MNKFTRFGSGNGGSRGVEEAAAAQARREPMQAMVDMMIDLQNTTFICLRLLKEMGANEEMVSRVASSMGAEQAEMSQVADVEERKLIAEFIALRAEYFVFGTIFPEKAEEVSVKLKETANALRQLQQKNHKIVLPGGTVSDIKM